MGQSVRVALDGGIVVENEEGHLFKFQLCVLKTSVLRVTRVQWDGDESAMQGMQRLDDARSLAHDAAESRGWLRAARSDSIRSSVG